MKKMNVKKVISKVLIIVLLSLIAILFMLSTKLIKKIDNIKEINAKAEVEQQLTVPSGYTGIYSREDLEAINDNLAGKYILMADIDLSETNWTPIASGSSSTQYFTGILDGNLYKISNMTIETDATNYVGFMGYVSTGTIKNLSFENVNVNNTTINATSYIGAVAGYNKGTITNVQVSGNVATSGENTSGYKYIGGLIGYNNKGSISQVTNNAKINNEGKVYRGYIGGIVGYSTGTITESKNNGEILIDNLYGYIGGITGYSTAAMTTCSNTGSISVSNITSTTYVAGIVGHSTAAITTCSNTGEINVSNITSALYVGGLVGNLAANMTTSYSSTNINITNNTSTSTTYIGGLVGCTTSGTIQKSYTTGNIVDNESSNTNTYIGGLIGRIASTVQNTYSTVNINTECAGTVGQLIGYGYSGTVKYTYAIGTVNAPNATYVGGIAYKTPTVTESYWVPERITREVTNVAGEARSLQSLFKQENYTGWDFNTIWSIDEETSTAYLTELGKTEEVEKENIVDENYIEFEGNGTSENPYLIKTADDLQNINRQLVDVYYKQVNDIEWPENKVFKQIGSNTNTFKGTLDGNNYVIRNLRIESNNAYAGMFGYNEGTIQNINLENVTVTNTAEVQSYIGALVGYNTGTIQNITVNGTLNTTLTNTSTVNIYEGGIVGYNTATIKNVTSGVLITQINTTAVNLNKGGVIGYNTGTVTNIENNADIETKDITLNYSYVGGAIGYNTATVSELRNNGKITNNLTTGTTSGAIGGVVGYSKGSITKAENTANILDEGTAYTGNIGGTVGYSTNAITESSNNGDITVQNAYREIGGILGLGSGTSSKVSQSNNTGDITVNNITTAIEAIGGIVGDASATITECNNTGKITVNATSAATYIGGIVGDTTGAITTCSNKGEINVSNITSTLDLGGVAGKLAANMATSYSSANINITNDNSGTSISIGGLVGETNSSTIQKAYSTGNIVYSESLNKNICIGGLIARLWSSTIQNTYSTVNIDAQCVGAVGQLIGNIYNSTIKYSYSIGTVDAPNATDIGGISGEYIPSVTESYWIPERITREVTNFVGKARSLQSLFKQVNYTGWDFNTIWSIDEGTSTAYLTELGKTEEVKKENIVDENYIEYEGDGTSEKPYLIKTADDLQNINRQLEDVYYKQVNDIEWPEDRVFKQIGSNTNTFKGTLDGDNYTIKNLKLETNNVYTGIFSYNEGIIQNINLENVSLVNTVSSNTYVGSLVSYNAGTIKNVSVSGIENIVIKNMSTMDVYIGGVVGYNTGTIENITSNVIVTEKFKTEVNLYKGGIVGYNTGSITNITNDAKIELEDMPIKLLYIGGTVGYNTGTITEAINNGTIINNLNADDISENIGGIVGYTTGNITKAENKADILGKGTIYSRNIGGIAGYVKSTITECSNSGEITLNNITNYTYIGGLTGYQIGNIVSSYNKGNINVIKSTSTNTVNVGGLVGYYYDSSKVEKSYSTGKITINASLANVGGLIGNANRKITVENCYSTTNIIGTIQKGNVSALIAYFEGRSGYTSTLNNSYAIGRVDINTEDEEALNKGGLIAYVSTSYTTQTNSYWSPEIVGVDTSAGTEEVKTLEEIVQQSNFVDWDFDEIWGIDEGISTPYLKDLEKPSEVIRTGMADYKVEHYKQTSTGDTYTLALEDIELLRGNIGETVTAVKKEFNGFALDETATETIKSGTILGDGSLVLKLYYTINEYTVTFKDGETTIKTQSVKYGNNATAPTPIREGYYLSWDKEFTNVTEDIIVNAIWTPIKKASELKEGDFVKYDTGISSIGENGVITCIVLYDAASEYGLQIISKDTISNVTLGSTDFNTSKNSYNNAISTLNSEAEKYLNTKYATSARCVGSNPNNPNSESTTYHTVKYSYASAVSGILKKEDTNYLADSAQITKLNIVNIGQTYWLASRRIVEGTNVTGFMVQLVYREPNTVAAYYLAGMYSSSTTYGNVKFGEDYTLGLRPCFSLRSDIETTSGDGETEKTAYTFSSAQYTIEHYKQNKDLNDYEVADTEVLKGLPNTDITATAKTYEGFTENTIYEGRIASGIIAEDGSLVLKLYYDRNSYRVTLNTNEGIINSGNVENYTYGVGATLPTDVTKTGYTFAGWFDNEELTGKAVTAIEATGLGDKTYFAKWEKTQCIVTFKNGEDTVKTETVDYGSGATAPTLTKEGYTLRWDKDFTNVTENLTVNAVWTANTNTPYKVEHYKQNVGLNEYELAETENLTGTTDSEVTAVTKTYEGFTENVTHENRIPSGIISGDGSLVLKLYYDRNEYTVTLNTNGGTINSGNAEKYTYGVGATLPTNVTKTGYSFTGWFDNQELTGEAIASIRTTELGDKEYFAKWTINKFTVTFKDGEDTVKTETVEYGSSTTAPNLTKEGYTLSWDKDFTNVTEDLTVTAVWTVNKYTVTFKDGEDIVKTETADYGSSAIAPELTKTGYTLSWDKDFSNVTEDLTVNAVWTQNTNTPYKVEHYLRSTDREVESYVLYETENLSGITDTVVMAIAKTYEGFTENIGHSERIPKGIISGDGSLVLKLYYDRNEYTVTLNTNGGTINSGNVEKYTYGVGATLPTNVTKTGYSFAGWFDNQELTGEAITAIGKTEIGKKEYFAKWTTNKFTVTFKDGEDTVKTETVEYGSSTTAPNLTKEGYTLSWDKDFSNVTEDLTVNAIWTVNKYTVTFKDGEDIVKTETVEYGSSATAPNLTKEGYTLSWDKDFSNVTEDLTVNAIWTVNKYTVTFKDGEDTVKTETVEYGLSATAPSLTKEGYTLSWDKDFSNVKEDLTVNAIWTANTNTVYKVEHYKQNINLDGYELADTENLSGTTGDEVTAIPKTYEGFAENVTHEDKIPSGIISGDGSLVLRLYYDRNEYTVTLNTNGGTINSGNVEKYTYGIGATLPTNVTKTGYTFAGWFDNQELTGEAVTVIGTTEIGNKEYFAKWTTNKFTVTFKDGEDIVKTETVEYGLSATAPSLTKAGYTLSWDKDFTNVTEDLTVNAVWTVNKYTVTFKNGEDIVKTETVDYSSSATAPELTKIGYTLSWDKDFSNVKEDLTVNAIWTVNKYTVTFKNGEDTVKTETVDYGLSATAPNLTKEGYTLSWDKDFSNVTEDLTVNAVWTANTNTVYKVEHYKQNINLDGYELADTENLSGTTGGEVTAIPKTYEGFTENIGHSERIPKEIISGDGSLVLKLYYDRNEYTVTLNTNGGTINSGNVEKYTYGIGVTLPINVTKTGYTFAGWFDNKELTGDAITAIGKTEIGDKEYFAKWTINQYTVTFKNGEDIVKTETVDYGSGATAPSLTKEGYTLSWDKDFSNVTEDMTVNAIWTVNKYTVTFKDGEDTVKTETVDYGSGATSPSLTKEGYTLSWDKDFSNVTEDLTVNAIWTPRADTIYKVEHYLRSTDLEVESYQLCEVEEFRRSNWRNCYSNTENI